MKLCWKNTDLTTIWKLHIYRNIRTFSTSSAQLVFLYSMLSSDVYLEACAIQVFHYCYYLLQFPPRVPLKENFILVKGLFFFLCVSGFHCTHWMPASLTQARISKHGQYPLLENTVGPVMYHHPPKTAALQFKSNLAATCCCKLSVSPYLAFTSSRLPPISPGRSLMLHNKRNWLCFHRGNVAPSLSPAVINP